MINSRKETQWLKMIKRRNGLKKDNCLRVKVIIFFSNISSYDKKLGEPVGNRKS